MFKIKELIGFSIRNGEFMEPPRYAFFDFDGTLIAQDSFLTLLKKSLKSEPWRILFILLFKDTNI